MIGQKDLLHRASLEQDESELERINPSTDYYLYTIVKLNVVTKRIYWAHMKTLTILQAILLRLQAEGVLEDDQ